MAGSDDGLTFETRLELVHQLVKGIVGELKKMNGNVEELKKTDIDHEIRLKLLEQASKERAKNWATTLEWGLRIVQALMIAWLLIQFGLK